MPELVRMGLDNRGQPGVTIANDAMIYLKACHFEINSTASPASSSCGS